MVFYPFSFKVFQFSLQCGLKGPDSDFGLAIGLWMCWRRVIILNSKLGTEISEFGVVELFSVIGYQSSWDTKPTYDGSPYKIAYLLFCDYGQGLGLIPFGEVIYCDDDEFALTLSNGQRSQYIQSSLLKGPGTGDRRQGF